MAPQGGNKIKKFDSRHVTPGIFAGMESEVREVADEDPDVVIKKEKHDEQDGKLEGDDISQAVVSIKKEKHDDQDGKLHGGICTVVDSDDDGVASVYALQPRNDEKAKQRRRANERLRDKIAFEEGRQAKEDWNQFLGGMETDEIASLDSGCVWDDDPNVRPSTPTGEHALPVEERNVLPSTPTREHAPPVEVHNIRLSPLKRKQLEEKAKWVMADAQKKIRELQRKLEADMQR